MFKKLAYLLLVVVLASCSNVDVVHIKGTVDEGNNKVLYLERLSGIGMEMVDSVKLKPNGNFDFKLSKGVGATFYYLKNDQGRGMNLILEGDSSLNIHSKYASLEESAEITGPLSAQKLQQFSLAIKQERKAFASYVKQFEAEPLEENKLVLLENYSASLREFKDSLGSQMIEMPITMASYFVLFQRLNEQYLLFDENIKEDYRYFATVATSLNVRYPEDPRVIALYQKTLAAYKLQRQEKLVERIASADEGIPDIALPNANGDTLRLSEINNKVVLLTFWASQSKESRMWNSALRRMHSKYKSRGLEIFQVSVDNSKVLWEQAMENDNITWKSVCDFSGGNSKAAAWYNVKVLPTTFIIDREGDVQARISDEKDLEQQIKALL